MLRLMGKPLKAMMVGRAVTMTRATTALNQVRHSHGVEETDEEFDQRFINYFNRPDIDHWEIRKAMNELANSDCVADPKIICSALRACRRLNDYALTTRFLESQKDKCGDKVNEFWPYIMQEIKPTLDELGINTPEELGYDKPELALQSVFDM